MAAKANLKCPQCDFTGDREQLRKHFLNKMNKKDLALQLSSMISAFNFWVLKQ